MTTICTLEQVKADLGITDATRDDLINRLIGSVTDFAERKTRRALTLVSESRRFDGTGKGYIQTDDFIAVGQVQVVGMDDSVLATYATQAFRCSPYNSYPRSRIDIINPVSDNPYRTIGLSPYCLPKGFGNILISGVWGSWPTIPAALNGLGIDLVKARLAKVKTRGYQSASIGGESLSFSDKDLDVGMQDVLLQFKKDYLDVY